MQETRPTPSSTKCESVPAASLLCRGTKTASPTLLEDSTSAVQALRSQACIPSVPQQLSDERMNAMLTEW